MIIAFVFAAIMNLVSYWFLDRIVLAMYGAQPVDEAQRPAPRHGAAAGPTRAQIRLPRIYVIRATRPTPSRRPQPAARGVAVTEGIMRILDEDELEGVPRPRALPRHDRDVLISTIAATLAGAITYLAHMAQWAAIFGGPLARRRGGR